jgi:hypothetical protein
MAELSHLEQRAPASLLHIVAMSADGKDIGLEVVKHRR